MLRQLITNSFSFSYSSKLMLAFSKSFPFSPEKTSILIFPPLFQRSKLSYLLGHSPPSKVFKGVNRGWFLPLLSSPPFLQIRFSDRKKSLQFYLLYPTTYWYVRHSCLTEQGTGRNACSTKSFIPHSNGEEDLL
jgi:hypothetical protein